MAHPHHEEIRTLYGRCCGYCGVSEDSSGGQLTVDHYRPRFAGGADEPDNLVYACFRCNLFKSDFYPETDSISTVEHRILHPRSDDVAIHFVQHEHTGRLIPTTETGRFHIAVLQLNRPELVALRLRNREERIKTQLLLQMTSERDLQRQIIVDLTAIIEQYQAEEPEAR